MKFNKNISFLETDTECYTLVTVKITIKAKKVADN